MSETITVTGMSCEGCEQTVEEALQEVSGVTSASADHEADEVTVDGDADVQALVDAIDDAGYEASA